MKFHDVYDGSQSPFEGDFILTLRGLPAGALVTSATITVEPANTPLFEETVYESSQGSFGTAVINNNEVDFHARRTLARTDVTGSYHLYVDLGGGIYTQVTHAGAFKDPDTPAGDLAVSGDNLPALTVTRFKLLGIAGGNNPSDPAIATVIVRSVPTNVSLKLGKFPPFWTHLGELAAPQTSTDFTDILKVVLATLTPEGGFYALPLVVHSDTIARLKVTVAIDYMIEQRVLPPHLAEINVPYNFSTWPGVAEHLTTVKIPRDAVPVTAAAKIRGEFAETRVAAGAIGEPPAAVFPVEVSPAASLAQAMCFEKEIAVTAIDLPLGKTEPGLAGMHISIQFDDDGKPSGTVLTTAAVVVGKPLPDQSAWGSATLSSPFRLLPGERYWLILQSATGKALWESAAQSGNELPLQASHDAGMSWRTVSLPGVTTGLAGQFRLRDVPEKFTIPLQLQIGKGPGSERRRLDEFAPLGRIEFTVDFAGSVSSYLSNPVNDIQKCSTGELIQNGDFSQLPINIPERRRPAGTPVQPPVEEGPAIPLATAPPGGQLPATALPGDIEHWVVSGRVLRTPLVDDNLPGVLLLLPGGSVCQTVPVVERCAYRLHFQVKMLGAIEISETQEAELHRLWRVNWFDADHQLIRRDKDAASFITALRYNRPDNETVVDIEKRLIPPSGALQAEICFTGGSEIFPLVYVSFQSTSEYVENSHFHHSRGKQDGWTMEDPADLPQNVTPALAQTLAVQPGKSYRLAARVRLSPGMALATKGIRLELTWLDSARQPLGGLESLALPDADFLTACLSLTAPAQAAQARIRLIEPSGAEPSMDYVSLTASDLIEVPLIFLGEAPGQLNISDLRLTYDLPAPSEATAAALSIQPQRVSPRNAAVVTLAQLSVNQIAGVGQRYSEILAGLAAPIVTIEQLAALDPDVEINDIPRERRLELKTAAEMILAIPLRLGAFSALGRQLLEDLLTMAAADMAAFTGQPLEAVEHFQRSLRALRFLLKNAGFRQMRLADLMPVT